MSHQWVTKYKKSMQAQLGYSHTTYLTDTLHLLWCLAIMLIAPGKFKVEVYSEEEKKNAGADLYCEMNDDDPWKAENKRDDKQLGKGLKVYYLMNKENPPTLELDIAPV